MVDLEAKFKGKTRTERLALIYKWVQADIITVEEFQRLIDRVDAEH
jgi:hypothetical protein